MTTIQEPTRPTALGFGITLPLPVPNAVELVTAALKTEGFGVLTTIDVQQTLRNKIEVEVPPYIILGACNPHLAHRALSIEPDLGMLLPCNVVVAEVEGGSQISIADPLQMLGMAGDRPELMSIAQEAEARLRRVVRALDSAT